MRNFLFYLASLCVSFSSVLLSPSIVFAGLEEATPDLTAKQNFRPWCGRVNNDCTVTITGDKFIVNGGTGITKNQIKGITLNTESAGSNDGFMLQYHYITDIFYAENGEEKIGRFIFINSGAAAAFRRSLRTFCGVSACKNNAVEIKIVN